MICKVAILAALAALPAVAQAEGKNAFGLKAGALGLGLEYTYQINDRIAIRGGVNGSEYGFDDEESGIEYEFDLVWDSLSIAADLHPTKSPFRLTAGLLANDNRIEAVSVPIGNVTIGDTTYTPAQVGSLVGRAGFDDTAPFLGLGWDWSRKSKVFGVSLDLGVLDQGDAQVSLRGTGSLLGNPAFESDIAAETAELEESLDDLGVVPYLSIGFLFRF
jgi:hypothetical protein